MINHRSFLAMLASCWLAFPGAASAASLYTESLLYTLITDSGGQQTQSTDDAALPESINIGDSLSGPGDIATFLGAAQTTGGSTLTAKADLAMFVNCGGSICSANGSAAATINFDFGVIYTGSGTPTVSTVPVLFTYSLMTDTGNETVRTGGGTGGINVQAGIDLNGAGGVNLGPAVPIGQTLLQDILAVDIVPGDTNTLTLNASVFGDWDSLGSLSSYALSGGSALASVSLMLDPAFESLFDLVLDPGASLVNTGFDPNYTAVIPLPAAFWLFGTGLLGLAGAGWKRCKA